MRMRHLPLLLGFLLITLPGLSVPETPEDRLKAAYTLNFAKFVQWDDAGIGREQLQVCYTEGAAVANVLADEPPQQLGSRRLVTESVRLPGNVERCQLLFIHEPDPQRMRRLLATLAELPILLISDARDFARHGGMIGLIRSGNKLRFQINLAAVRKAGLQLDATLLDLAAEVIGK